MSTLAPLTEHSTRHLIVRTDASAQIGTGHFGRCLALAQAWKAAGGTVTFLMAETPPPLVRRLHAEGIGLEVLEAAAGTGTDAARTAWLARQHGPVILVLDGYHFDASFRRVLRAAAFLVVIDDGARDDGGDADIVLNQNLHTDRSLYRRGDPSTRFLLGPRFALIRQEFLSIVPDRCYDARPRRLLITSGGSDPQNVTGRVLEGLGPFPELSVRVVVGPVNPHLPALTSSSAVVDGGVELVTAVDDMAAEMAWADVAISAAGSTCWELAHLGVPTLVVSTGPNQRPIAAALGRHGIAVDLGPAERVRPGLISTSLADLASDGGRRAAMGRRGRALIDGLGAARVASAISSAA